MLAHTNPLAHGLVVLACCGALALYGWAWVRSPHRSDLRLWCWTVGLATLAASTSPTVERWGASSFTGHMVQHLLMIVVAAPLLVLARSVMTIGSAWPWRRSVAQRHLESWWRRSGPLLAPAAFVATLYLTHLTGIYDRALGNQLVHDGEHIAYLVTGCALWSALTASGRAIAPARVGAVFGVIAASALLGVVLLTATTPLIPTYAAELGASGALDDQRAAASLMWVGGMAITLPLLLVSVWRWAAAEQRIADRTEQLGFEASMPRYLETDVADRTPGVRPAEGADRTI